MRNAMLDRAPRKSKGEGSMRKSLRDQWSLNTRNNRKLFDHGWPGLTRIFDKQRNEEGRRISIAIHHAN